MRVLCCSCSFTKTLSPAGDVALDYISMLVESCRLSFVVLSYPDSFGP